MRKKSQSKLSFSIELRKMRIALFQSQRSMARRLHVPASTYSSWEYGTITPSYENYERLLDLAEKTDYSSFKLEKAYENAKIAINKRGD